MTLRKISLIILSLLVFYSTAHAFTGYVQRFDEGRTIAWGDGGVTVVGEVEADAEDDAEAASPLSVRKAASKARKQMLDMILSVRIDAKQTVSAYLSDNDDLAAQLRGQIHNSLFEGPDLLRDARTVTVSESLRGKLAELILPKTVPFQSGIPPRLSTATGPAFVPEPVGGAGGYTGVIVDARGLDVTPCLLPVIYGQDGLGAYGAFLVSRQTAVENGVAAYANTASPEVLAERVGKHPLAVKAARVYGSWKTDLVVSTQEAALIRAIMQSGATRKGGVVIVIDTPPAPARSTVEEGDFDA
ncbi:MAG: hypothetical protein H0S80_02140 [Desulfovibrionaceae bacterium]|nr:hypothetical protein [Desulfovibrionaceae bacterium]